MNARPTVAELVIGGGPEPWGDAGFAVDGDRFVVGTLIVRLEADAEAGIAGWTVNGLTDSDLDGLPTSLGDGSLAPSARVHPNGALGIDHVVVSTPDMARTQAALAGAGFDLRREREVDTPGGPLRQAFYRPGEVILEVVSAPDAPAGPATFWGLVFSVADLDVCAAIMGENLGSARDAVQPGRRIATVRREAGLGLPVALMTPHPGRG